MWKAALTIFVAIITPSSENIQSPQGPDIPILVLQCQQGDHVILRYIYPRLYILVEVVAVYNIILPPGRISPGRGDLGISIMIPNWTSPPLSQSYPAPLPQRCTWQTPGTMIKCFLGHYLYGSSILLHWLSGNTNIMGGQGYL